MLPTTSDRANFVDVFECQSPEELLRRRPPICRKYARRVDPQPKLIAAYHSLAINDPDFARVPSLAVRVSTP